jgi:nitric oxide reductase large subunit
MLRNAGNSDGTIDLTSLQNTCLSTMEDDHNNLYSGKNKDFIDVANEVIAAQSNVMSQYKQHLGSDPEKVQIGTKDLEKHYGKMNVIKTSENYNAHFTYKQLWRFVFNDNMKPLPNVK